MALYRHLREPLGEAVVCCCSTRKPGAMLDLAVFKERRSSNVARQKMPDPQERRRPSCEAAPQGPGAGAGPRTASLGLKRLY